MADRPPSDDAADPTVLVRLPDAHRDAFKDPLGPIYPGPAAVVERTAGPIIAVGDIVTADLVEHGRQPDLAIVDGRTMRRPVDAAVTSTIDTIDHTIEAVNPAGTITKSLVDAIATGLSRPEPTKLVVDGEEDLAVLPAVLAARPGAAVVYGQPDEGIVLVEVTADAQARARRLLERFEGDVSAVLAPLRDG